MVVQPPPPLCGRFSLQLTEISNLNNTLLIQKNVCCGIFRYNTIIVVRVDQRVGGIDFYTDVIGGGGEVLRPVRAPDVGQPVAAPVSLMSLMSLMYDRR